MSLVAEFKNVKTHTTSRTLSLLHVYDLRLSGSQAPDPATVSAVCRDNPAITDSKPPEAIYPNKLLLLKLPWS